MMGGIRTRVSSRSASARTPAGGGASCRRVHLPPHVREVGGGLLGGLGEERGGHADRLRRGPPGVTLAAVAGSHARLPVLGPTDAGDLGEVGQELPRAEGLGPSLGRAEQIGAVEAEPGGLGAVAVRDLVLTHGRAHLVGDLVGERHLGVREGLLPVPGARHVHERLGVDASVGVVREEVLDRPPDRSLVAAVPVHDAEQPCAAVVHLAQHGVQHLHEERRSE